ncbi:SWIM zinc finger family protein [Streptomyces scabichelini]|uniref:SWIM zinc finger family protein n=1 Tax=Streptomyces scabichelini TaxID=2711217 RepID=UPI0030B9C0A0
MARRALWAARRGEAGASAGDAEEGRSAAPQARPAARGTDQGATGTIADGRRAMPRGPRPGDVAREALRGAAGRAAGAATRAEDGPGVAGAEDAVRSGEMSEPSDAGRPEDGGASGTPRPGDVAREALRSARSEAGRAPRTSARTTRTSARTKGVGGPSHPSRRAAARAKDLADRLGDASEEPPWPDGEAWTTKPDEPRGAVPATAVGSVGRGARVRPTMPALDEDSTMPSGASPARDSDLRRTFPALPPRPPGVDRFAGTWWGNAWVSALEEMALDPARLARGRVYAGEGHVDAVTVTPGLVLAYVHGSRPRPYRVQIRMRTLADDDWERFLDAAAERPGHIAALLDKDMPQSLAQCGVELLPGPGDLEPHCSCPDFGHPCKHAAALCYQTARLLDEDPFVLLLLRGRGERELLDALSRRNAALAARSARGGREPALPGVRARDALAPRTLPPLPEPLPTPAHPEQPPVYPAAPGGPDPFALDQLATDAATRAHALLTTGRDPVAELTLWQDAVRLAATRPGSGLTATTRSLYASLASAAGRTPAELARAVAAWRQGGLEGLAVLEEPWDPPAGRFDRARPLLLAADFPAFRPWHNHLTHPRGHIQLRLGHDGLWYAYESEPGHDDWWPRGTPDLDPVGALTGLGSPGDQ